MNILESISVAFDSLLSNRLRAILTMLGVIIGVATVIAMLGIGRGVQAQIRAQLEANGANLLYVMPGVTQRRGNIELRQGAQTLTLDDARALADPLNAPAVAAVSPELNAFLQVAYGANSIQARVTGVTESYLRVNNAAVARGEFITPAHVTGRATVAVLGATAARDLFGPADPIGQSVRINGVLLRVVGVMRARGGTGFGSTDDQVIVPLTTAEARLLGARQYRGSTSLSQITVQVRGADHSAAAMEQIKAVLRHRHRIMGIDDFTITNPEDLLRSMSEQSNVFTLFLSSVAAISLLVGGIGIMNIMLVSVTERTREIGLRKAVGARRRDVLTQFLIEAAVLSVTGGLIGVALAYLGARLVGQFELGDMRLHALIGPDLVLLATIFSIGVGLFFGLYPANRAAHLAPIDALRTE